MPRSNEVTVSEAPLEPQRGRAPSIRDVARLAGVSHQTVSRVLNNHPSIRPETKQRVLDVMDELQYTPNRAARALVTSRSRTIGILSASSTQYGPASSIQAIEAAARESGYWVSTANIASSDARSIADGLAHLAAGSLTHAREALERAVRGWEERGRTWEATWARIDLAQCLLRMNRHADAAAVLADARRIARDLGSDPLTARTDELARTARGRGLDDEPWRPLTVREFEVARRIADGLTNAEIAAELTIAPKTASAHVEHILAKLGVARRAEIATWVTTISRPDSQAPARHDGVAAAR
jgi:DNA-binding CsgD family transcriptional regulator/transcriptional regulator with XRE-family HTH domain